MRSNEGRPVSGFPFSAPNPSWQDNFRHPRPGRFPLTNPGPTTFAQPFEIIIEMILVFLAYFVFAGTSVACLF
jgi:hypothetical protein